MAEGNIQILNGNFSFGPDLGFFYTVDFANQQLDRVEADGTPVGSFFVGRSQIRNPVKELHYDGTFFWTLEDLPSDLGIVIKKWRLYPVKSATFPNVSPSEFRWQDELTLINRTNIKYASSAFATEHFHRTFQSSASQGDSTIILNSTGRLSVGDVLYLGPSDSGDFDGVEEEIVVGGIAGNEISFTKGGGLEASYISEDPVDFIKALWIFNEHSFTGTEDNKGTIQRFTYPAKNRTLTDQGHKYSLVTAADFDETTISFVRGDQIMDLDITNPTFDLGSSLEANLREADNKTPITVFDLISVKDENIYYKLQQKETTEDGEGSLTTEDWGDEYNFQTISSIGFVNSTALSFDQRFTLPFSSGDTIAVTAQVRDQFNFPVLAETVQFSATVSNLGGEGVPGTVSPEQDDTDASGIAETTYTPSITQDEILVAIKAQVVE
jgi:hypothetical protein